MLDKIKNGLLALLGLAAAILFGLFKREQSKRIVSEAAKEQVEFELKKDELEDKYEQAKVVADALVDDYQRAKQSANSRPSE